jgi:hypothetical protein
MNRLSPVFVLCCLLAACGKREKPIEPYINAVAGAEKFYTSGKMVTTTKGTAGATPSMLIEGVMPNGATIKIWIKNYTGALDTLSMDSTDATGSYLPPTPSIEAPGVSGVLIVTEATPAFKGIFEFKCIDSTRVKGDFKVAP